MSKEGCVPGTDIYAEDCCVECATCTCECNCCYCLCECAGVGLTDRFQPYREAWLAAQLAERGAGGSSGEGVS